MSAGESVGYDSWRDDGGNGYINPPFTSEILARQLWKVMNKAMGGSETGAKDIRKEYNVMSNEIKTLKLEYIVQVFMRFLSLFESHMLGDTKAGANMMQLLHGGYNEEDLDVAHEHHLKRTRNTAPPKPTHGDTNDVSIKQLNEIRINLKGLRIQ